ncbi:hypothetical protein [Sorangium sp. So ce1151]|uniref:hypothetical protein n=1 Tax=Sorangium sp. So ce1151 TaxID=3133332 RepID=UPI003F604AA4
MVPASLVQATAVELLSLYRSRSASPVEALRAVLAPVERHGAPLNAFALLDAERALDAARASRRRRSARAERPRAAPARPATAHCARLISSENLTASRST